MGTNSMIKTGAARPGLNKRIKRTKTTNVNKLPKISNFGLSNCTNLVLYGSNLGSTVNKGRFPVSLQKLIYLPPDSYSMGAARRSIIIRRLIRKIQFKF